MPVLVWERRDDGKLRSDVITSWRTEFDGEEYRELAEALDREVDVVLDRAVKMLDESSGIDATREFVRTWVLGRAIEESGILNHKAMKNETSINLWVAMDKKTLLSVRSDSTEESSWLRIRSRAQRVTSRPDQHLFDVGLWIQQQDLDQARVIFAGSAGLARNAFRRPVMRSMKMRESLERWLSAQTPEVLEWVSVNKNHSLLQKAIAKRWPNRGPGSAKRPEHYSDERLDMELFRLLDDVVRDAGIG